MHACVPQLPADQQKPATFKPLGADEEPGPGTLLGIDTEFVAHSPPDKVMKGCVACRCWHIGVVLQLHRCYNAVK
jgi:hypothetical protein